MLRIVYLSRQLLNGGSYPLSSTLLARAAFKGATEGGADRASHKAG